MQRIRIESPKGEPGSPISAFGTRLFVNDHELTGLQDISLHFPVRGPVYADFRILAAEELNFEGEAELHVEIVCSPRYEIVVSESDGVKSYRCKRVED